MALILYDYFKCKIEWGKVLKSKIVNSLKWKNTWVNSILTERMKKSWCNKETTPKLVYLNMLSIIHMRLGRTFGFELNVVINIGTSPVLWWFAMTNVLSLMISLMSSPSSTTGKKVTLYQIWNFESKESSLFILICSLIFKEREKVFFFSFFQLHDWNILH